MHTINTRSGFHQLLLGLMLMLAVPALSANEVSRDEIKGLDEQVQDIKKDVLELSSELSLLEEKLLFPSNTQVSVFISMHEGDDFRLDSIRLRINDKVVAQHLYTYRELEALQRGGVQRVYTGNVPTGSHNMVIDFIGSTAAGGEYKRSGNYRLSKEVGPKFVEVKVAGPDHTEQDIQFRDW